MKLAHLHDGNVLQLPDATPDEMVDQIVAHHHAASAQQAQDDEQHQALALQSQQAQPLAQEHAADRDQHERHHNDHMMMALGAHTQKTQSDQERNAHLGNVTALIGQLVQRMQAVEQIAPMLMHLTQAINALTAEVKAGASQIVQGVTAEKQLQFDGRGRPTGIKPRMLAEPDLTLPGQPLSPRLNGSDVGGSA